MAGRLLIGLGIGAAALVFVIWLSSPKSPPEEARPDPFAEPEQAFPEPAQPAAVPSTDTTTRVDPPSEPHEPAAIDDDEPERHSDHDDEPDLYSDVDFYADRPMSAVPHHVVRGWGARGGGRIPGLVGAFVVVDPNTSDEDLVKLARDIRDYHHDAEALSVRILDSEHAATYDRHVDGGALASEHLIATVNRSERLGTDQIEVRGRVVPAESAD